MTESEIRELVDTAAKQAAREAVRETLITLGIDADKPFEFQRDMQHLRGWRNATDTVKGQGIKTTVVIIVTGILGAIWYFFESGGPAH